MKRPTMLVLEALLKDLGVFLDLSVERDVQTIVHRLKHEGDMFLQVTLPLLSDSLERGLEAGMLTCPTNFRRYKGLPCLLRGFFERVFRLDGKLLPDACPDAIYCIRQICRFFKKQKIPCGDAQNELAIRHFLEVEDELRHATPQMERKDEFLDQVAGILWTQVFPEFDYAGLVCNHGPGVTADRYLPNERYRIRHWNTRSELTFPSDLHCYPNYGYAAEVGLKGGSTESVEELKYLRIRDELPVRVVFVPKTQTAPRVIAIEPSHMQYMQQSIKDLMYTNIEAHRLTKRSIRFSDQTVNQRLAYRSSIDKRLATLDLKDASDRVHLHLVQRIFKTSGLLEYLEDARSLHATLPNGQNIVLSKYASMGSALCFPVEACVFYTLVQVAMHRLDRRRPCSRSIENYSRSIAIYGDDIIIPVEYTDAVVDYLESFALKVNVNKSFRFSNFRESCGADFYKGIPVNPVYARKELHDDLRLWTAEDVMSWNATADLFYMRGLWSSAQTIRDLLRRVVRRTIPRARKLAGGLAHFSLLFDTNLHWNADLSGWKQKRLHYNPTTKKDCIDGYELACLNRWGLSVHFRQKTGKNNDPYSNKYRRPRSCDREEGIVGGSKFQLDLPVISGRSYRHVDRGFRSTDTDTEAWTFDRSIRNLPYTLENEEAGMPLTIEVDGEGMYLYRDPSSARPGYDFSSDNCLTEVVQSDPLLYLANGKNGIDFLSSTKRGSFKSKCRWTSLLS